MSRYLSQSNTNIVRYDIVSLTSKRRLDTLETWPDRAWYRTRPSSTDALDAKLVIWAREIPDLDPLTEGIVERIQILAHDFDESMAATLAEFDLDRRAFKLLGRLRSVGTAVPAIGRDAGQRPSASRPAR